MSPRKPFTLVEIVLVMVLLTTLLALAAPELSKFSSSSRLKDSARQMVELSRYANSLAIAESKKIKFWIDGESHSYGISSSTHMIEEMNDVDKTYSLPDNQALILNDEDLAISTFFPDGTYESSFEILTLSDERGDEIILEWEHSRPSLRFEIESTE